ncbi:VOC family protein [Streptomyces sp. NPDC052396]|uniref:VOC family protein n=1 Tax=Streptomyces sp. NPDC052396 TaxID=3365689 RepID=UPI0037CD58E9
MSTRLTGVVIRALDVRALSRFWAQALGWTVTEGDGATAVRPAEVDGVGLLFVSTGRPKAGKNPVHLDLPGGPAEVRRLLGLGAVRVDIGQGEVPWEVLADPEGNEFCVLPRWSDEGGRIAQICQDAADPGVQGAFWAAAGGWRIVEEGAWGVRLRAASGTGPELVMGPPVAARTEPHRLHLLLEPVPGAGPHGLTDLGAVRADGGRAGEERWETFIDPEGNEFGVLPRV